VSQLTTILQTSTDAVQDVCKHPLKIEEFHRELKQLIELKPVNVAARINAQPHRPVMFVCPKRFSLSDRQNDLSIKQTGCCLDYLIEQI